MAEKTYKCLNPVGIHTPVDLSPLAPRLDKLDGKTIFVSIGAGGEQDITIPLPKKLQEKYLSHIKDPPKGRDLYECYDVETMRPDDELQRLYDEVIKELGDYGITLKQ